MTLLVRGASLAAGMSDYLVRQIQATPSVAVRLGTRVVGGRGDTRLEGLVLEDEQARNAEVSAAAVFILIGAKPQTERLAQALSLDKDGFVLTGGTYPARRGRYSGSRTPSRPAARASSQPAMFATAPSNGLPVRSEKGR